MTASERSVFASGHGGGDRGQARATMRAPRAEIRVVVADDHAVVRKGICLIAEGTSDLAVVAEAASAGELVDVLGKVGCDVVILDLSLPDRNGLDVLRDLRNRWATVAVVVLTLHDSDQYVLRAFRSGAAAFLTKDSLPEELCTAVRKAASGMRYVSPRLAERLALELISPDAERSHRKLSDRELQIFTLIARGESLTTIAQTLSLSVKTVSTYKSRILEKLGLTSLAELIQYAVEHRLY